MNKKSHVISATVIATLDPTFLHQFKPRNNREKRIEAAGIIKWHSFKSEFALVGTQPADKRPRSHREILQESLRRVITSRERREKKKKPSSQPHCQRRLSSWSFDDDAVVLHSTLCSQRGRERERTRALQILRIHDGFSSQIHSTIETSQSQHAVARRVELLYTCMETRAARVYRGVAFARVSLGASDATMTGNGGDDWKGWDRVREREGCR